VTHPCVQAVLVVKLEQMSQNDTDRIRALRALLTELDTTKYAIRLPFTDTEAETLAGPLRKTLTAAADELFALLSVYERRKKQK